MPTVLLCPCTFEKGRELWNKLYINNKYVALPFIFFVDCWTSSMPCAFFLPGPRKMDQIILEGSIYSLKVQASAQKSVLSGNVRHLNLLTGAVQKENLYSWRTLCLLSLISSCTGYFRKVYRNLQVRVPRYILKYLSIKKLPHKKTQKYSYYVLIL